MRLLRTWVLIAPTFLPPSGQIRQRAKPASHHWCHDCATRPSDTGSNRTREGEPSYATSGTTSGQFLTVDESLTRLMAVSAIDLVHLLTVPPLGVTFRHRFS